MMLIPSFLDCNYKSSGPYSDFKLVVLLLNLMPRAFVCFDMHTPRLTETLDSRTYRVTCMELL